MSLKEENTKLYDSTFTKADRLFMSDDFYGL